MIYKFLVGQTVEYTPIGGKAGLYTVVRQMPEEPTSSDLKYRIKSLREDFERNVLECQLSADVLPERDYGVAPVVRSYGGFN
jgi:hypothetical protein